MTIVRLQAETSLLPNILTTIKFMLLLGVHFGHRFTYGDAKEDEVLQDFVMLALKVFFHAVDAMLHKHSTSHTPSNNFALG